MKRFTLATWLLLLLPVGCGETRAPTAARNQLAATYLNHVKPLLDSRCVSCHGGTQPAGQYDLSSYPGLLAPGTDHVRNAVPGDATSKLLTKLDSAKEAKHWTYLLPAKDQLKQGETAEQRRDADLKLLTDWVVTAKLAYFDVTVHPPGWVYPGDRTSEQFHGGFLRAKGWDPESCRGCHGEELTGGTSKRSCASCHKQGLSSCTTCHGSAARKGQAAAAPPTDLSWGLDPKARGVGAHQKHLAASTKWAAITCDDCHLVPSVTRASGHLYDDAAQTKTDFRAEVTFGSRAGLDGVTPSYDATKNTCSVYCHGASFASLGQGATPKWTEPASAKCGTCHNVPALFGGADCSHCHQQTVVACKPGEKDCLTTGTNMGTRFIKPEYHGDGIKPLGRKGNEGTCYSCHGTKDSAGAPGPDLRGNTDISAVTVGLHKIHNTAGSYRDAVPCTTCHVVPKTKEDKGHMDNDVPAEVVFSDLARGKLRSATLDLKPSWDRTTATCSNTYCHGLDGAKVTSWPWTKQLSPSLNCSSCHGMPPAKTLTGGTHSTSTDCRTCHSKAYTSAGQLDPARHINGKVD